MKKLLLPIFSLLIILLVGEITVRLIGQYNYDGNFEIGMRTLRPYKLPVNSAGKYIGQFLEEKEKTHFQYDSIMGWTNAPSSRTSDGIYLYNAQGMRVGNQQLFFNDSISKDTYRIILLGDSFTQGDEVHYEKTWGHLLEQKLNKNGTPVQVINLGVSAYGMDQAFLRWEKTGKKLNPDLVIFGLQMENVRRNLNLFRSIYTPNAQIPFSKPRFIVSGNNLELINQPPIPPEKVVTVLSDFNNWEMAGHEYFYRAEDYQSSFFLKSKFIAFLRENISPDKSLVLRHPYGTKAGDYPLGEEPAEITLGILGMLGHSVKENNSGLLIVHLPHIWGLGHYRKYGYFPYQELMKGISFELDLLDTTKDFEKYFEKNKNDDFYLWFHYSELGNEIIAESIFQYLLITNTQFTPSAFH